MEVAPKPPWRLGDVWIAWQPVVNLTDGHVVGCEALARGPRDTPFELPAALFATASTERDARRLERHLRALALVEAARALPEGMTTFINVDSRWPDLPLGTLPAGLPAERVALELSESQPLLDDEGLLRSVKRWRDEGHPIVIDDYGTGYASAATVVALQPDIVKLDRRLIRDIDQDERRRSLVHSIRQYTADIGIRLVAESVETLGELVAVRALGLDLAQGFLLARPASPPPQVSWPVPAESAPSANAAPSAHLDERVLDIYARSIEPANVAAYVVDRSRRVVGWNPRATEETGFTAAEMIGLRCFEGGLTHTDKSGRTLCFTACPVVWAMVHGASHSAVVSMRSKAGTRHPVRILATPIWDEARGHVLGAIEQFERLDGVGPRGPGGADVARRGRKRTTGSGGAPSRPGRAVVGRAP